MPPVRAAGAAAGAVSDVIVIGAGCAGLAAAIEARVAGANVLVLEKMRMVGGNSLLACEAILSAESPANARSEAERKEILRDHESMLNQIVENCRTSERALDELLVVHSQETLDWLKSLGCEFPRRELRWGFRHVWENRPARGVPIGVEIMRHLLHRTEDLGIPVLTRTRATKLTPQPDAGEMIVTVMDEEGRTTDRRAKTVILATGGYAGSLDTIRSLWSDAPQLLTTNSISATGDGLLLAKDAGAAFADLDAVSMQPTTEPYTGAIVPTEVRMQGAVLVNAEGRRFVNELEFPDVVSRAILAQKGECAWLVADHSVAEVRHLTEGDLQTPAGFIPMGGIRSVADSIGAGFGALAETLDACRRGEAESGELARPLPAAKFTEAPFYAMKVRPAFHATPGGVRVSTDAAVLRESGEPVPGLFAAGEVTGGVWGRGAHDNLGLSGAIIYGRIAGVNAARIALQGAGGMSAVNSTESDGTSEAG